MDERHRETSKKLRAMSSRDAADFLINKPQEFGRDIRLVKSRSWKRSDQIRLARHFFKYLPFSDFYPYEVFLSFMSLKSFLRTIKDFLPKDKSHLMLLEYYLYPALNKFAKYNFHQVDIDTFKREICEYSSHLED